jgi:hypothetical protein
MTEVLSVIAARAELEPLREEPDPVVLRGITLAPKHGVEVEVADRLPGGPRAELATQPAS